MLAEQIWFYIGDRVDHDNILPSEDEIYIRFQSSFEIHGANPDIIGEIVQSYAGASDLTGVEIQWEGSIEWKPCNVSLRTVITTPNNSKKIS